MQYDQQWEYSDCSNDLSQFNSFCLSFLYCFVYWSRPVVKQSFVQDWPYSQLTKVLYQLPLQQMNDDCRLTLLDAFQKKQEMQRTFIETFVATFVSELRISFIAAKTTAITDVKCVVVVGFKNSILDSCLCQKVYLSFNSKFSVDYQGLH